MTDAPKISRAAGVAHLIAGRDAYLAGKPVTDCPHDSASTDPAVRFAGDLWVRGYSLARAHDER